jgi:hypothetical protein
MPLLLLLLLVLKAQSPDLAATFRLQKPEEGLGIEDFQGISHLKPSHQSGAAKLV